MDRAKILDRVKKLLSLSENNPELNEAMNAAKTAQKLIETYRIEEAELDAVRGAAIEFELIEEDGPQPRIWKTALAGHLARANGCQTVYMRGRRGKVGKGVGAKILLFGTKANIDSVIYLFWYLSTTIEKLSKRDGKGKGTAWRRSYQFGAVKVIGERLREAMEEARDEARRRAQYGPESSTALVRVEGAIAKLNEELQEAQRLIDERYKVKAPKNLEVTSTDGWRAGKEMARKLALDPRKQRTMEAAKKSFPK